MSDDLEIEESEDDPTGEEDSDGSFRKQTTAVEGFDRIEGVSEEHLSDRRTEDPERTGTEDIDSDLLEHTIDVDKRVPALVELSGTRAGEISLVESGKYFLGRDSEQVDLSFLDSSVSRVHASLEVTDDHRAYLRDLASSNGTFVNGDRIENVRELSNGDRITLGARSQLTFRILDPYEVDYQRRLFESKIQDDLTGAKSRAYLDEQMRAEMSFADRHDTELSLALFDIDHFKPVNDAHGHVTGDKLLQAFADLVETQIRDEDLFARYGGDEFAVLFRQTEENTARAIVERVCREVRSTEFDLEEAEVSVTVSAGIARYDAGEMEHVEDWLRAADLALYRAKDEGRDRIELHDPSA